MRFYLDEDLSQRIATIGRERYQLDVISSHDVAMDRATDDEQLAFAAEQGRCIVTGNDRHFTRLTYEYMTCGQAHAGVLVVPASMPRGNFDMMARALASYHELHPEPFVPYLMDYLQMPRSG